MRKETSALSEEHMGSTSNGTTVTRKETSALSATKRNRLNNRKLVFEVDDCDGRIVGEDSQTFITKGGCLVRESAKFDGTTWRKQQPLLKTDIISKCTAIMNPPRGVKIPDWVLLCDRFASEDFEKISARNKMNRSKNLVPLAVGLKSMARVVHEKMKQGKQMTAIGRYEICHYSRKKDGMINETADKILRDLRDEEANSSSTPAEICMARLGHIPGYLK
nr:hypothetical protein [Tanacetum cinerariifolium]